MKALNLYENLVQSAKAYPEVALYVDTPLSAFPELGTQSNYQALAEKVTERAQQLSQWVSAGQFVMVYKSPAIDTYWLACSVFALGAVPVMVSHHLSSEVLDVFAQRLETVAIIYDEQTEATVKAMTVACPTHSVAEILAAPVGEVVFPERDETQIAYMTHTSGTTGIPKLIAHSMTSMGWRTEWQRRVLAKMAQRGLCAFHISPVHSRFNIGVSSAMALGFPLLAVSNPEVAHVANVFKQYQPYAVETHPNNFVQWRDMDRFAPGALAQTRYFHSTFDAINKGTMEQLLSQAAPNAYFLQVYGQSECGPMILNGHTLANLSDWQARDMGVGLADLTEARILNASGEEVAQGESGHIYLYSKGRALTYYGEDQRFAVNVRGAGWDSGDYGYKDENGNLWLQDRQVDLVETLPSTLAIEDYLLDTLNWLSEIVIIRDADGKAQPIIAVKDGETVDWASWWQAIGSLPYMNEPIEMAYQDIPRTATMKVQRLHLAKQLFGK